MNQLPGEILSIILLYSPWDSILRMENINKSIRNRYFDSLDQWLLHSSLLSMFNIQPTELLTTTFSPKELFQRIKYFLLWFPLLFDTKQPPHITVCLLGPAGCGNNTIRKQLIHTSSSRDYDPIYDNLFVFVVFLNYYFSLYQFL